jgi:hypothetical protein
MDIAAEPGVGKSVWLKNGRCISIRYTLEYSVVHLAQVWIENDRVALANDQFRGSRCALEVARINGRKGHIAERIANAASLILAANIQRYIEVSLKNPARV